ncbi:MAG: hypothetical protein ACP5R2_13685 [Anaerolineae bacterium]
MKLQPQQRMILIAGALMGALLGAGIAWLLTQPNEWNGDRRRQPLRPSDLFKLTANIAALLREIDEIRRRV